MDWQKCYETGHTPWDKGGAHPEMPALLQQALQVAGPLPGKWLAPGCGTGHDLIELARTPGIQQVLGLDIAPAAVAAAAANTKEWPAISVELADWFHAEPEHSWLRQGPYHGIWEHTCFCAIPPNMRSAYATQAARLLPAGGLLLAVFFLNPWDPEEDPAQGPPFGVSPGELDGYFSPDFELLKAWVPSSTYPGREGREECRIYRRLP